MDAGAETELELKWTGGGGPASVRLSGLKTPEALTASCYVRTCGSCWHSAHVSPRPGLFCAPGGVLEGRAPQLCRLAGWPTADTAPPPSLVALHELSSVAVTGNLVHAVRHAAGTSPTCPYTRVCPV